MSALPQIDLGADIATLGETALRIKAERDAMEATLRDITHGCDIMLQPPLNLTGSFLAYVLEVRRVAQAGLVAS